MAQTNTVSVFVQMTAVTASGIADRPEDCYKLLLQWLRSSFCQVRALCALCASMDFWKGLGRSEPWGDSRWSRWRKETMKTGIRIQNISKKIREWSYLREAREFRF